MESDNNPSGGQPGGNPNPAAKADSQQNASQNSANEAPAAGGQAGEKPSKFDQSLRATDIFITIFAGVNALAAIISASVAIWAAREVASTSAQTDKAIGKLAILADQTKRQADATTGQLVVLREQVGEARKQTKAISQQTDAIKSSSIAAVKSAGAQIQSAQAQTQAAKSAAAAERPGIALGSISFNGLNGIPEKDGPSKGRIKIPFNYQFKNVGGSPWKLIDNAMTIEFLKELPAKPDYSQAQHFPGGGLVIGKGESMSLMGSPTLSITPEIANGIKEGTLQPFIWGIITYDVFGEEHRFCYAYEVPIVDGSSTRFIEAGSAAYHCDT